MPPPKTTGTVGREVLLGLVSLRGLQTFRTLRQLLQPHAETGSSSSSTLTAKHCDTLTRPCCIATMRDHTPGRPTQQGSLSACWTEAQRMGELSFFSAFPLACFQQARYVAGYPLGSTGGSPPACALTLGAGREPPSCPTTVCRTHQGAYAT